MSAPVPPTSENWKRHAIAVFASVHIVAVIVYAMPRPPRADEAVLEHPEVRAELANSRISEDHARTILAMIREYIAVTDRGRDLVGPYLRLAGSTQSWHMFGGTPPRFPLVFVVEVKPLGEQTFVLFQDLNWGTADSAAMNFRHRKVHENLAAWESGAMWNAYAAYWCRHWDSRHPDRPAAVVRLSVTRLTTPPPEQIRVGDRDRHPEPGVQVHEWVRP
jgi:hypothetical protein